MKTKARGRKREARRWLDELTLRTVPSVDVNESFERRCRALAALEVHDKSLYDAVDQIETDYVTRSLEMTREEWLEEGVTEARRLRKLRDVVGIPAYTLEEMPVDGGKRKTTRVLSAKADSARLPRA